MTLPDYTAITRYLVMIDHGKYGVEGRTHDDFDAACDAWLGANETGSDASVWVINFGGNTNQNITSEAATRVAKRCNDRALDIPDWLYVALPSLVTA